MVRSVTHTTKISDLYLKNADHSAYGSSDSIEITSDFQRGDDETGVWSPENKQNYIKSLKGHYPTGILTFVKDHESATAYQDPWKVLDGGNRLRAIRDFINNKFHITKDDETSYKFSDLSPQEVADFNTIMIPCQFLTLERDDADHTIAEMFCCLNTSAKPLSHGELFKAHGWKQNIWEIEMAKKLVGDVWDSTMNDDRLNALRAAWSTNIGELSETKRCSNVAMMLGYIISAKTANFKHFDSNYNLNKNNLSPASQVPNEDEVNAIYEKLTMFVDTVSEMGYSRDLFGRPTGGIPSKSKIAPIWKPICEGTLTPEFREKMVRFYNEYAVNDHEVTEEYVRLLTKNGDNHTNASKINAVHEYINSFD